MLLSRPTALPSAFLRQRCLRRQVSSAHFLSTSPAIQSSTAPPAWRFETGYSFHGKPGSPVYRPPGSPAPAEPEEGDNSGRPDWRTSKPKTLQQGLPADHPLSVWRDAQLAKAPWGAGHDWFFVEEQQDGRGVTVGVADGVGGWEESGIDPSHFSQALMWFAREAVRTEGFRSPKTLLDKAFEGVSKEKGVIAGSSTACIISLDAATGLVRAANLGDSTFLLLRPTASVDPSAEPTNPPSYSVIHNQPSQTHFFNAPRQLAKIPKGASKAGALIDMPKDADMVELMVQPGDILLLATDGFSDNVFPTELEQLVALVKHRVDNPPAEEAGQPEAEGRSLAQTLADVCVNFARICSFKPNKESPFEVEARRYGHHNLKGGKVDDVTVVAVVVGAAEEKV